MEEFWILILVLVFATNSLDKAETVQLEDLPLQTFDELFVDEWWDKDEAEDLKTPASTNFGQIEPNSTDQNAPLTESDHSENAKNGEEHSEIIVTSNEKRKIIDKFYEMKDEFKQNGKYSKKEWNQIEDNIAKHLKVNRSKIYEWKKEFGLTHKFYGKEEHKHLIEKFDQMKAELKRAGFKSSYKNELDETVAKELGLGFTTIYRWKRELDQPGEPNSFTATNHRHSHSEQKKLMKHYYEIKNENPKIKDDDIAKIFKIASRTLVNWKRQFKLQQLHPNFVDGHSVENNAGSNVQEIGNSNSGNI